MSYRVLVDDNFHYMDETERYELGAFPTLEAAIQAAQGIVDEFLQSALKPGLTAQQLFEHYIAFGEDPFILPPEGKPSASFSAWDYCRQRCESLCAGADAPH